MKLLLLMFSSFSKKKKQRFKSGFETDDLCKFVRVLFYSTETLTSSSSSSRLPSKSNFSKKNSLYSRISPLGNPNVSIVPVLDKWIADGKYVTQEQLQSIIKQLRDFRRFRHALEISQWMSDKRFFVLSPGEVAIRLDLIAKVHGLEQAEKYFDNIPKTNKRFYVYGALLKCYAHEKSLEKAEAHMQKMRDLGYLKNALPYNVMLTLYSQVGQHEKLDTLMEEMKEKGIRGDKFTFNIRLSAYAGTCDIDGMEKFLKRIEADPEISLDWDCYFIAADGYIKAGLIEQAMEIIKKSEKLINQKCRRVAYEFILTLYARIGNKAELYRIWNKYKSSETVYNTAYLCMVSSLLKLDDIEGAEKVLEEWEAEGTTFDFRVPNLLIAAYCKKGLVGKAEKMIHNAVEKGKKPLPSTWDSLATGYLEDNQIQKAVETMRKAILSNRPGWKPNHVTLAACLEYLKEQGDIEGAEEFVRLLGSPGPLPNDVCERLLNYIKDGKPQSFPGNEMDGDSLDDNKQRLVSDYFNVSYPVNHIGGR